MGTDPGFEAERRGICGRKDDFSGAGNVTSGSLSDGERQPGCLVDWFLFPP